MAESSSSHDTHAADGTRPFQTQLEALEARRARVQAMGSPAALQKRASAGQLNARERVAHLCDPDSYTEFGEFAHTGDPERAPADGKVAGYGRIEGRPAVVVSNDFTTKGASSTIINGRKLAHAKRVATQRGLPMVFLGESSGGRIPETLGAAGMGASGGDPEQYLRQRESPWAAAVLGQCYGSSSWYTVLSDFRVMRKGALLSVSSARLVQQATGARTDDESLGGWQLHAQKTGLVDQVVDTDEAALDAIRAFLSYLPGHAGEAPPRAAVPEGSGADMPRILDFLPESRTRVYDMKKIVRTIVDKNSWFELKASFGKTAVTGLARLDGQTVGIIASNPLHRGGALDVAACQKITSFLVLCDSLNVPLINLVDVPGFQIGLEAEEQAAPARIMNYMMALQSVTVPKLTVIVRKTYGQAYLNMGGGRNSDEVILWPTAEIGFMAPAAAVAVVHGLAPGDPGFDDKVVAFERETSPWAMAGQFAAQHVVAPEHTRKLLVELLAAHSLRRTGGVGQHRLANWPYYV